MTASRITLLCLLLTIGTSTLSHLNPAQAAETPPSKPNIVYILCDDLGYGDVHCLNPKRGKIATPNLDRLAADGMSFSEAHSGSSVCTPTRYGILTGRYCWRTRLQNGVLQGASPPLIDPQRLTVAQLLHNNGYHTACIGKWHLGMTFGRDAHHKLDWTKPIKDGPTTRGFDYYYGISASLDMPPFAFIENDKFPEVPSVDKQWVRKGPAAPSFEAVNVLPTLTRKAVEYIGQRAADRRPFFLYLPLNSPHAPIVPGKEWKGKSGLGDYGDFVMQTDDAVGQVLKALDWNNLSKNTLVIFTSDNGCSPVADIPHLEKQGHFPSENRRGMKADIFDGGHRIPLIVRWPAKIIAGSKSNQLVCLTDLMATCADFLGVKLPDNAGEDSVSNLPVLRRLTFDPIREAVVHHSINGSFAIRTARWKVVLCPDSGGWSDPKPGTKVARELLPIQCYDMSKDEGETTNKFLKQKDSVVVSQLVGLLHKYVEKGRSTPGEPQKNDAKVAWQKNKDSRPRVSEPSAEPADQ